MEDLSQFRLNFSQLMYYISAARNLSYSKAATECHVVPNAISKQVARLENGFGVKFFNHNGKSLELTEAGDIFLKCAVDITSRMETALTEMAEYDPSINMHLSVGYYDIWSESFVAPAIQKFKEIYPRAEVTIEYCNIYQLMAGLRNGAFDVAFSMDYLKVRQPESVSSFVIGRSPMNLIAAENHPLSSRESVSVSRSIMIWSWLSRSTCTTS